MLIDLGACDGAGTCADPPALLCDHGCEGGDCITCSTDTDCADGDLCVAGACVPPPPTEPGGCGCAVAARNGANGANTPLALLALALALALAALTVVVIARIPRARRRRA